MRKKSVNSFSKIIITAVFIIFIIIGTIVSSLSVLKDEAIKTHLKIAELHSKTISEQIEQTISSIDLIINSSKTIIENTKNINTLDNKLKSLLNNRPYIRSINILNEEKRIIFSSSTINKNLIVNMNSFYPKPLFNKHLLRFGKPWIGRDFKDGKEIKNSEYNSNDLTFIPIVKMLKIKNNSTYILINMNSDYFNNKYIHILKEEYAIFDLIRVDGTLLLSSNPKHKIGSETPSSNLFQDSLKKKKSSGLETIYNTNYLSAYELTEMYPLNIAIRLNLDKNLKEWETKRENIVLTISFLIIICVVLVLVLIRKNNLEKEKEISFHKLEIENKKRFKVLFEQSTFLAAILKDDGSIVAMNKIALKFLKKDLLDIKYSKFWDLNCWKNKDKIWLEEEILNFSKNSKIQKELHVYTTNKSLKTLEFILTSINISGKTELVALGLDITERKEKEEKIKQAYVVFQNTHDGIMITDEHANIININKAFIKSTGYNFNDIFMKNPRILSSGIHKKDFYTLMWNDLEKNGFWEGELINKKKNGTLYSERLRISCVFDSKGKIKNFIGVFSDITKQKEQENKLKEQEKLIQEQSKLVVMGEMIENIAHQWRQPLSIISSISTSMQIQKKLKVSEEEDELKNLKSINDSAQYLSKTIDDFRDYLKTDKMKYSFKIENTLEKSLNLLSSKLKNRDIKVIKNIQNFEIEGIQNELIQVFMNIIGNAKDAFNNEDQVNKYIFVDIFKEDNNAIILIKDNAGGINENIINRVFEPYFTTKHKSQGTGIGLYMSQEIINNHMNGFISCFNSTFEYDNKIYKGAIFKINIPLN